MRIAWGLALVAACRGGTPPPPAPDAAVASVVASNAPKSFSKMEKATLVEIRESSDGDGRRGDLAFRLMRVGEHFDWDARGVPFANSLAERLPDPLSPRTCSCDVTSHCPGCDDVQAKDIERKSGRVSAVQVDAFLDEIAKHGWVPGGEAGAPVYVSTDSVHIAITIPGEAPIHLSRPDAAKPWLLDGKPIEDSAAVERAWQPLRDAVHAGDWLAAMSPKIEPSLPAGFVDLARASIVEIHDSWNGLGETHDAVFRLERSPKGFDWRAKIASFANSLGDSVPDPYSPKEKYAEPCTCEIDLECHCEHARPYLLKKSGTVAAAPIESFLALVAKHTIDPSPPASGMRWTDDYPKGHVIVWLARGGTPIHLSFLDQQRQWRANGRVLSPDPSTKTGFDIQHQAIWTSYQAALKALDLPKWETETRRLRVSPKRK